MGEGKILIVEDNRELAKMLRDFFRSWGYDVITTSWGEEALAISQKWIPDVIIQDIRLPDIDGYEVVRRLQGNLRTRQIAVIFLTELDGREKKLQGLKLGAIDYVVKPFDLVELGLKVSNALRSLRQPNLFNPVTRLPEETLLAEELRPVLGGKSWGALRVTLEGLDAFREVYGFAAGNDLLKAVALVISNTVSEVYDGGGLMGHLNEADFLVVGTQEKITTLEEKLVKRLQQTVACFYPAGELAFDPDDPYRVQQPQMKLFISRVSSAEEPCNTLSDLKKATARTRRLIDTIPGE